MKASARYPHFGFVQKRSALVRRWSELEATLLRKRLAARIEKPIFVCGLARSGTTLVTQILDRHEDTGSFHYSDLPFVEVPYFWSFASRWYYGRQSPRPRPHGDNLMIAPSAPDAFEELLWQKHLPDYHGDGFCQVLDANYTNQALADDLQLAMKKILHVRGRKSRYLAKGNYHLHRLGYLLHLYPDAKVVLCVRDPFQQAQSLARVHRVFMDNAEKDSAFADQLLALGHHEFGPHRRALQFSGGHYASTLEHWQRGEDYEGYLLQWIDVYAHAMKAWARHENVYWVDNADFIADKPASLGQLLQFCALPAEKINEAASLTLIKESSTYPHQTTPYDEEAQNIYGTLKGRLA